MPPADDKARRVVDGDIRATRRDFVAGTAKLAGAGAFALGGFAAAEDAVNTAAAEVARQSDSTPTATTPTRVPTRLIVNGDVSELELDPRSSLLDVLREQLGITGAKKGCNHGQCGACTVHLDGQRVASCLTMAVQAHDREVATIEGLVGLDGGLHPMQQAFIDHDALQCGYCTPGQIMAAIGCVQEGNAGSDDQIREAMSGNLCRCGAYVGIVAAVAQAAPRMERS